MDEIISFQKHAEQLRRAAPMPPQISKLACVDSSAQIADNVNIGPFCVIGPEVSIGPGTILQNNVTLTGRVAIGKDNHISPGVVIGGEPQDILYDGTPTNVFIGDRNVIRESVTINRATTKEDQITAVGNDNFLMACVHIAHDCKVGNNIVMANGSMLGGHVHVFDHATISGNVGVHHFARIGPFSFLAGVCRVIQDVPPYLLVDGNPAKPRCVNIVALKRNNFSAETIQKINEAYRMLYRSKVGLENAREILRGKNSLCKEVNNLLSFVEDQQNGRHGRGREQKRRAA